jgi:replication initiation and membrane attachment protein DnaB
MNIETVEDAMAAAEKEHKKLVSNNKTINKKDTKDTKETKDNLPLWFDKNIEKQDISKEEQEELDKLLKDF